MFLDLTPEQKKFRDELRAYFAEVIPPELFVELRGNEGGGPIYHQVLRRMARDGLLGLGWPKAYGGQERPLAEQFLFADEVQAAGFPLPFLTLNTVAPTLMRFGTEEQKASYLPRILAGECHFAIGYSEPEAGTDLAALRTRAERDGDHYVVNGSKIFTSLADFADYIWLAVRTDPDAPKHRGISMLIVPTDAPGFSRTPIYTMTGVRTNATFYENVRVPVANRVGEENSGWTLITSQLNHERVALSPVAGVARLLDEVCAHAHETRLADGRRVIDQPFVRTNLARVHAGVEALKLMNWKAVCAQSAGGGLHPADASILKVYSSELYVEAYRRLLEVLGPEAVVREGSPGALLRGRIEQRYRSTLILTFGGGTNEVQRDIIAMAGLGLPNYKS